MKKKLFALSLLLSVSTCFLSCGDDDDDDNGGGQQSTPTEVEAKIKAIDLGLSVKWCNCNLGSETPEGFGNYYGWGETVLKEEYTYDNYLIETGSAVSCGGKNDFLRGSDIKKTQNDIAFVKLGDGWRMPTQTELQELIDNCSVEESSINGVNGVKFTAKNGNSIFLPKAGYKYNTSFSKDNLHYWSSKTAKSSSDAFALEGYSADKVEIGDVNRIYGLTIRPVKD